MGRPMPGEPVNERTYEILTDNCAWGVRGASVELALTEGQETALLRAGTVKRATVRPKSTAIKPKGDGRG